MPRVPTVAGPEQRSATMPDARFAAPQANAPDVQLRPSLLATPQVRGQHIDTPVFKAPLADPNSVRAPQIGDYGAGQLQQEARGLGAAGDAIGQAAMAYQRQFNATVVDDSLDRARQAALHLTYGQDDGKGNLVGGYKNLKGEAAFRRPGDKSLDTEVGDAFDEQIKAITSDKLTNADQRAAFSAQVDSIRSQLVEGSLVHMATAQTEYRNAVYANGVKNGEAAFALIDPTDRKGLTQAADELDKKVATLGILNGRPPEEIQQEQFASRSRAVGNLIATAMSKEDYAQASAVLNEYADKIDPDTAAKYRLQLTDHVSIQAGEQLADAWFKHKGAPAYAGGDATRGFNINIELESHGRHVGPDGKILTSPNGTSFGVGQLSPDTADKTAKIHGAPAGYAQLAMQPTAAGEAANRQIAQWHWGDLIGKFGGDVSKASAAYNAGAGYLLGGKAPDGRPLEGALKWAARTGQDWRKYPEFKPETQARIANVEKAMGAGDGVPPKPSKSEGYAFVDGMTTDPKTRAAGYARIDKMLSAADYDERQGYDDAFREGLRVVGASGGDINAIPPQLRAQIDPKDFEQLQTYGRNLTDGSYRTTDPNYYYQAMTPEAIRGMSPADVQRVQMHLDKRDGDTLRTLWEDYHSPTPDKGPGSLALEQIDNITETHLQALGIDPKPSSKKNPEEAAQVGVVKGFIHRAILDIQRQQGLKITDYDTLDKTIGQLFLKQQPWKKGWAGNTKGSDSVLASGFKDIPVDIRDRLVDQLKNGPLDNKGQRVGRGLGRDPTHSEVLDAYYRRKFYGG